MSGRKKVTIHTLKKMKIDGVKFSAVTAYDYPTAIYADQAGIDVILVGDSKGHTKLGLGSTLPVTMDSMLESAYAVKRGSKNCFVIGDMPYMSYQISDEDAVRNAAKFIQAGCDAVKLEGYYWDRVAAIARAGICVSAHLGLLPQRLSEQGGYRVNRDIQKIDGEIQKAFLAGADMCLIEGTPPHHWSNEMIIWGIGAGPYVDGQLLISDDMLGLFPDFKPRFAKQYIQGGVLFVEAFKKYSEEVKKKTFPEPEHWYESKIT